MSKIDCPGGNRNFNTNSEAQQIAFKKIQNKKKKKNAMAIFNAIYWALPLVLYTRENASPFDPTLEELLKKLGLVLQMPFLGLELRAKHSPQCLSGRIYHSQHSVE